MGYDLDRVFSLVPPPSARPDEAKVGRVSASPRTFSLARLTSNAAELCALGFVPGAMHC